MLMAPQKCNIYAKFCNECDPWWDHFLPRLHFYVCTCMHHSKLQLNTDETEMILITLKYIQKTQILPSSIQLNGCDVPLSTSVQNLGVTLDQTLSFQKHIFHTCQACYHELHQINSICHYLIHNALKTLISALLFCLRLITVNVIHFSLGAPKPAL